MRGLKRLRGCRFEFNVLQSLMDVEDNSGGMSVFKKPISIWINFIGSRNFVIYIYKNA